MLVVASQFHYRLTATFHIVIPRVLSPKVFTQFHGALLHSATEGLIPLQKRTPSPPQLVIVSGRTRSGFIPSFPFPRPLARALEVFNISRMRMGRQIARDALRDTLDRI